jgi:hypothetical protein
MIKKQILAFLFIALSIVSCSKDEPTSSPAIAFTQSEGKAVNGQYTITGTITSSVSLLKVLVTKEGDTAPFIIDDTTAKNKNSYPYSYLITGITKDTYIIIDVYDQNNTKTSTRFLIRV